MGRRYFIQGFAAALGLALLAVASLGQGAFAQTPPPAPPPPAQNPQTGVYTTPGQPGRQLLVDWSNATGNLFAVVQTYDRSGRATWYFATLLPRFTATGARAGIYDGVLYSGVPAANGVGVAPVGPMSLLLGPAVAANGGFATTLTINWPAFLGVASTPFARQAFSGASVLPPSLGIGAPRPGFWVSPSQPGRGYFIEMQGDLLYVAAFGYRDDGSPLWLTKTAPFQLSSTFNYELNEYAGGPSFWQTGSGALSYAAVGRVFLGFSSPLSAQLSLNEGTLAPVAPYVNF